MNTKRPIFLCAGPRPSAPRPAGVRIARARREPGPLANLVWLPIYGLIVLVLGLSRSLSRH